ncbi:tellurite resistance TerB family protein [Microvirga alba]|uniref:TerB family tellurite resistance protein n=1 Tax=Microvirga alba TaxID=2791025 RepID=A0A931BKY4_9HYPH|nr:TerB family tellurite resistance protein [Microvirga alba]MBF9232917.1 TerB family tellurite resistance protein [Microvirga alba]
MSLISCLTDLFHRPVSSGYNEHLTVAALLTLVVHADGRVLQVEAEGLRSLLRSRFGLGEDEVEHLLAHAGEIEETLDPSTTLIDRILHDVRFKDRPALLKLAYRIAAIDGVVHDFEDDLIWRTGRLLGFSESDLTAIKAAALTNLTSGRADG